MRAKARSCSLCILCAQYNVWYIAGVPEASDKGREGKRKGNMPRKTDPTLYFGGFSCYGSVSYSSFLDMFLLKLEIQFMQIYPDGAGRKHFNCSQFTRICCQEPGSDPISEASEKT